MAQTIALQRGTTTVTANGSSGATLFTQSGGTATRVIVNNLGFYFTTAPGQTDIYIVVYLTQSGGQQLVLGRLYNQSPFKAAQFAPGISTDNAFSVIQAGVPRNYTLISAGTNGVASENAQSITLQSPGSSSANQLNSNFYMGPGDSIAVKARGSSASGKSQVFQTLNISYSFTTITES